MTALYEQYRPKTWAEVVGQDKTVKRIAGLRKRGLAGRAYWITGYSGTGKTTIARLIAAEVADPFCTIEMDAGELTIATLRDIDRSQHMYGFGDKAGRVYIVNEAHGLSAPVIRALLVVLEPIPAHVVWLFTTTTLGQGELVDDHDDTRPLLSRCVQFPLAPVRPLTEVFAKHARKIATKEGLNGQPIKAYEILARRCRNNLRAILQAIETGEMM